MQFSIQMQAVVVILMINGIYSIHETTLGLFFKNQRSRQRDLGMLFHPHK